MLVVLLVVLLVMAMQLECNECNGGVLWKGDVKKTVVSRHAYIN